MLALARPWLDDLRALSSTFRDQCGGLFGRDCVLNPTFAGSALIGGADADLIVEKCLIEVKTTVDPGLKGSIIYQMLGYALLGSASV